MKSRTAPFFAFAAFAFSLYSASSGFSGELQGVTMPDQITVGSKTLKLNGMGMREATLFKVDVYAAGLYVETPSKDPQAILDSAQVKHLHLHFVRDVDVKDIREAWQKAAKDNCTTDCDKLDAPLSKLNESMEAMKKGDTMSFTFHAGKFETKIKGKAVAPIEDPAFSKAMLSVWLGKNPPNAGLKQGLLGLAVKK